MGVSGLMIGGLGAPRKKNVPWKALYLFTCYNETTNTIWEIKEEHFTRNTFDSSFGPHHFMYGTLHLRMYFGKIDSFGCTSRPPTHLEEKAFLFTHPFSN